MDPCQAIFTPVTHPRLLDAHGTYAGLNVAFGQMTMAHHPRPAIVQALAGMGVNKTCDLRFNRVGKQYKRMHRRLKFLRTRLGRMIRDIRRKTKENEKLQTLFAVPLIKARQIRE